MAWERKYSDEQILDALRQASAKLPDGFALAAHLGTKGSNYEELKRDEDPSAPTIIDRFGGWLPALREAGVVGNAAIYSRGYHREYSDENLIAAVVELMREQPGWYLTGAAYEEKRDPSRHPSIALIRKRLRQTVGSWQDIQIVARSYLIAEKNGAA